jgi:hypothetical protein
MKLSSCLYFKPTTRAPVLGTSQPRPHAECIVENHFASISPTADSLKLVHFGIPLTLSFLSRSDRGQDSLLDDLRWRWAGGSGWDLASICDEERQGPDCVGGGFDLFHILGRVAASDDDERDLLVGNCLAFQKARDLREGGLE